MALEGQLRDLSLTEVLQLLALGRKQGALHVDAPLLGRRGTIVFRSGVIVDCLVEPLDGFDRAVHPNRRREDAHRVEDAVLDVLAWREGYFRFAPGDNAGTESTVQLAIEPLLMESTLRAEVWSRIAPRVPHARVVPAFVEVESQQLPLLRLSPAQWELLTRIDGQQDLMALAESTSRPLTDVAEMVHDLIEAGVLALHDGTAASRQNPTPPAMAAIDAPAADSPTVETATPASVPPVLGGRRSAVDADLWVPGAALHGDDAEFDAEFDAVFDPIEVGVLTPEGMPRQLTPVVPPLAVTEDTAPPAIEGPDAVAPAEPAPSLQGERSREAQSLAAAALGDSLAREGDLHGALAQWHAALRGSLPPAVAERLREQASLAARLSVLLA